MRKLNFLITQKLGKELAYSVCFSNIATVLIFIKSIYCGVGLSAQIRFVPHCCFCPVRGLPAVATAPQKQSGDPAPHNRCNPSRRCKPQTYRHYKRTPMSSLSRLIGMAVSNNQTQSLINKRLIISIPVLNSKRLSASFRRLSVALTMTNKTSLVQNDKNYC